MTKSPDKFSRDGVATRDVNLHPQDHLPKDLNDETFDVIVIGSGPAGRTLASLTASNGLSTVVVEEELFGGDCPFWACVPSKALLRPAETLAASRTVTGAAQLVDKNREVDVEAVFQRRDNFTQAWNDKFLVDISLSQQCSIVRGHGSLIAEKSVLVVNSDGSKVSIKANHAVVLATGSEPVLPKIIGLDDVPYWTPREATSSQTVPDHLIIVGAGAVGTELASAYAKYGSKVSLICSTGEILPRADPKAGKIVREELTRGGIEVYLSTKVKEVNNDGPHRLSVRLSNGKSISGTTILIAAGRKPRTTELGLESLDIALPLTVDKHMNVSSGHSDWLYAIGDTNSLAAMTHMGVYQAKIAASSIVSQASASKLGKSVEEAAPRLENLNLVTQIVFTDPNVGFVGMTTAEAKKKGINVREIEVGFEFPGAWLHAESGYNGWAQWIIDVDRNILVGATFVGREAGDLLHPSTVAIVGEVPVDRLQHAVAPFPTVSEVYTALSMAALAARNADNAGK